MDYFSKEEADVIGEISNISIGSSATAMNMMLGQPITITTPDVSLVHKTEILNDMRNHVFWFVSNTHRGYMETTSWY